MCHVELINEKDKSYEIGSKEFDDSEKVGLMICMLKNLWNPGKIVKIDSKIWWQTGY